MNRYHRTMVASLSACTVLLGMLVSGACADDTKAQIIERMAKRLDAVRKAKAAGTIGETFDGLVDAVKPESLKDKTLKKLVEEENADRKAFYELGAKEVETAPQVFALSAGRRNFRVAQPEEWLKLSDGKWIQKKDLKEVED